MLKLLKDKRSLRGIIMDENAKRVEKMVQRDLQEWYKLWNKLDKHGKKFCKKDLYRLNLLDEKIVYYQAIGILENTGNGSLLKGVFIKVKEALVNKKSNADTLKISFKARENLDRELYEHEGFDFNDLRRIRLNYQGDSIIGALLHKIKDWKLDNKINKEVKLLKCIFEHNYQNKFDIRFNNRMIEINMENHIEPIATSRTEYWEIINRNGKLKLNLGLFKLPIIREKIDFDSHDLACLAELERIRDSFVYPESIEAENVYLQANDQDYLKQVKDRGEFLGIIDKENNGTVEHKTYDLKAYVEKAKENQEQKNIGNNGDSGRNDEITEEKKSTTKEEMVI